jgi:hypothetical protein
MEDKEDICPKKIKPQWSSTVESGEPSLQEVLYHLKRRVERLERQVLWKE